MRNTKRWMTVAGTLALLLLAAPRTAPSQEGDPEPDHPMGAQHMGGQEMPEGHAEMIERHRELMAEHRQAMEDHMERMGELMDRMHGATGDAKVEAMAAVLDEMWSHRQSMYESMGAMRGMGMMGMGPGMMGGPGIMRGHPDCPMSEKDGPPSGGGEDDGG